MAALAGFVIAATSVSHTEQRRSIWSRLASAYSIAAISIAPSPISGGGARSSTTNGCVGSRRSAGITSI